MRLLLRWCVLVTAWSATAFAGASAMASGPCDPSSWSRSTTGTAPTTVSRLGYRFSRRDTPHFRLMCLATNCPSSVQAETGDLLERTYQRFYAEFKRAGFELVPVEARLDWFVFDNPEQYRDFARRADGMDSPYLESYYSVKSNQVVVLQTSAAPGRPGRENQPDPGRTLDLLKPGLAAMDRQLTGEHDREHATGGRLDVRRAVHEAAHLLAFNSGLQKPGVTYPLWVSEGLATSMESDSVESVGLNRENFRRLRQLRQARQDGRLMPLEEFVTLVQIAPGQAAAANDLYAQAWGLFNFLLNNRRTELRNYLRSVQQAEPEPRPTQTMLREFTDAFGSLERLDQSWRQYLESSPAN
jgi:hypothetical protein